MKTRIFVFGTLKEGVPNFAANSGRRVTGPFKTRYQYPLYLVGDRYSPWLIDLPHEGFQVYGQVFEVNQETMARMDMFERPREPDGYIRKEIEVVEVSDANLPPITVQAYLKPVGALTPESVHVGPLEEYTLEHAALYRKRSA